MKSGTGEQCNRSKSENPTIGLEGMSALLADRLLYLSDSLTNHKVGKSFPSHCSGGMILPLLSASWQSAPSEAWSFSNLFLLILPWTTSGLKTFLSRKISLSGAKIILITHLWTQNLQVPCSVVVSGHAGLSACPVTTFPLVLLLLVRELSCFFRI